MSTANLPTIVCPHAILNLNHVLALKIVQDNGETIVAVRYIQHEQYDTFEGEAARELEQALKSYARDPKHSHVSEDAAALPPDPAKQEQNAASGLKQPESHTP